MLLVLLRATDQAALGMEIRPMRTPSYLLSRVILLPWMPTPAISPRWPKMNT